LNIHKKSINQLEYQFADLVMDLIPKVMQVLREDMRHGRGERLTVPQFRVLAAIGRGIDQNKLLADRFGVSEPAMSRMLDALVLDGLINKGINKLDRRHSKISLTAEGEKLYNFIKNDARKRMQNKVSNIDTLELKIIINGLLSLQKNLTEIQDISENET
jgi:DNA-binding MarR family transcriptional regulator